MWALWVVGGITFLIVLKYAYLIGKRLRLIGKIRKQADEIRFRRNRFRSVFLPDGKTDLSVRKGETVYSVSVLTTPFRKAKYHFGEAERLEIFLRLKLILVLNPRVANNTASIDSFFRIAKYRMSFDAEPGTVPYVIPNPAPLLLTRASGTRLDTLGDGDVLFGDVRICGLRHFINRVLAEG